MFVHKYHTTLKIAVLPSHFAYSQLHFQKCPQHELTQTGVTRNVQRELTHTACLFKDQTTTYFLISHLKSPKTLSNQPNPKFLQIQIKQWLKVKKNRNNGSQNRNNEVLQISRMLLCFYNRIPRELTHADLSQVPSMT